MKALVVRRRDRVLAGLAAATGVVLLLWNQIATPSAGRRGTIAQAEAIESALAAKEWTRASEQATRVLLSHPFDSRTHFQLSQCRLAVGLPDMALEHLVWATAGMSGAPAILTPPGAAEIQARLDAVGSAAGETPQGRLRVARIQGHLEQWDAASATLASVADGAAVRAACLQEAGVLAEALHWPEERIAALPVDAAAVLRVMGAHACESGGGDWILMASGDVHGNRYAVRWEGLGLSEANDGWLLGAIDPASRQVVCRRVDPLKALTGERALIQAWYAEAKAYPFVFGLASGKAVLDMSPDARDALHEVVGLRRLPGAMELLNAYAFAITRDAAGQAVLCEAPAVASDMPAVAYHCGSGAP